MKCRLCRTLQLIHFLPDLVSSHLRHALSNPNSLPIALWRDSVCSMARILTAMLHLQRVVSPGSQDSVFLFHLAPFSHIRVIPKSSVYTASLLFCTSSPLDFFLAFITERLMILCLKCAVPECFDFWNIWRYVIKYLSRTSASQQNSFSFHMLLGTFKQ